MTGRRSARWSCCESAADEQRPLGGDDQALERDVRRASQIGAEELARRPDATRQHAGGRRDERSARQTPRRWPSCGARGRRSAAPCGGSPPGVSAARPDPAPRRWADARLRCRCRWPAAVQVGDAIRRMTEGPRFADVGAAERRMARVMELWLSVQTAARHYESVVGRRLGPSQHPLRRTPCATLWHRNGQSRTRKRRSSSGWTSPIKSSSKPIVPRSSSKRSGNCCATGWISCSPSGIRRSPGRAGRPADPHRDRRGSPHRP